MMRLTPYLHFDGNCREALSFYQGCLGGTVEAQTVGESLMAEDLPAEMHDRVLHATLVSGEITIMASDMSTPEQLIRSGAITFSINSDDLAATRAVFDKLAVGANVTNQLQEEFFGTYGDLTDRFGISWVFEVSKAE